MIRRLRIMRPAGAFFALLLALLTLAPVAAYHDAPTSQHAFANPHFQNTWERTDKPVADNQADRTWMWGPEPYTPGMQEIMEWVYGKYGDEVYTGLKTHAEEPLQAHSRSQASTWLPTSRVLAPRPTSLFLISWLSYGALSQIHIGRGSTFGTRSVDRHLQVASADHRSRYQERGS